MLIESCTALIENAATPEADRLDATITRAVALHNSGQTDKALAEIAAVIARDPDRARAFRARGEIMRQLGKTEAAFEALNRGDPARARQRQRLCEPRQRLQQCRQIRPRHRGL